MANTAVAQAREFVAEMDRWFAGQLWAGDREPQVRPPMFQPFRLGGLELANRVIVSPMDMYSARDGVPGDFHLVHLGSKALGGAGLVMTEMVCVSPSGRITPMAVDSAGPAEPPIAKAITPNTPMNEGMLTSAVATIEIRFVGRFRSARFRPVVARLTISSMWVTAWSWPIT